MTKTIYEIARLGLEPLLPPLHSLVRSRLKELVNDYPARPSILDVGGRKSPYTIGLPADVTIIDLPRISDTQKELNLGLNDKILGEMKSRRSNISAVVVGDMTNSDLPNESFDLVVSVEVLEHVVEDEKFVSEVGRVLKPGGAFLMTTPNGDWKKNTNPDHVRHYKREQLAELLERYFVQAKVEYAIAGGRSRRYGLKSWSLKRPVQTALSIGGNVVNSFQSRDDAISSRADGTQHLIGLCRKKHL